MVKDKTILMGINRKQYIFPLYKYLDKLFIDNYNKTKRLSLWTAFNVL